MFPLVHDAPIRPPILPQSLSPPSMAKTGPASQNGKSHSHILFPAVGSSTVNSGYGYRNIPAAESPPSPPLLTVGGHGLCDMSEAQKGAKAQAAS